MLTLPYLANQLLLYRLIKADEQTITAEQTDIMCAFTLNYVNISTVIDI